MGRAPRAPPAAAATAAGAGATREASDWSWLGSMMISTFIGRSVCLGGRRVEYGWQFLQDVGRTIDWRYRG